MSKKNKIKGFVSTTRIIDDVTNEDEKILLEWYSSEEHHQDHVEISQQLLKSYDDIINGGSRD